MANNICTEEGLAIFAQAIEENLPIIDDAVSLNAGLKGREGGKVKVVIPDPGTTVVKKGGIPTIGAAGSGSDITDTDVKEFEKEFEVAVATNAASVDALEEAVDLDSFDKEIIQPRKASLAAGVQDAVVEDSWTAADSAYKTDATGSSFDGFGVLSDMAGDLADTRVKGELVGYMAGSIESKIAKSATEKFNGINNEEAKRKGVIGEYAGITWKRTAMPVITPSALESAWTASAVSEGDDTITLNGTSSNAITASTEVKKGTAFTISGITKKDLLGNDMIQDKVFIVAEDAKGVTDSANGHIVLKVGAINAAGAHANVSALPASGATVTAFLTSGKKYAVVWGFAKGNLSFDGVKLPSGGNEVVEGASDSGKVIVSAIVNGDKNRKGTYRFDAGFLAGAVDSRRAVVGFIKLTA